MKEPWCGPGLVVRQHRTEGLFQSGRNAREGGVEVRADPLNDHNDRDRDAGGDKAILDGGGSLFVCKKSLQRPAHVVCPLSARFRRATEIHKIYFRWISLIE